MKNIFAIISITISSVITSSVIINAQDCLNVVRNGDFNDSSCISSSVSTDYSCSPGSSSSGSFAIIKDASKWSQFYLPISDHSLTTSSNYVVFDGISGKSRLWSQTVSVKAGKTYIFRLFGINVSSIFQNDPPGLSMFINGIIIANSPPLNIVTDMNDWTKLETKWTSSFSGVVAISIELKATGFIGNDVALDDIFFGEDCILTSQPEGNFKTDLIVVYPNPVSTNKIYFGKTVSHYILFDSFGSAILEGTDSDQISVLGLNKGFYYLQLDGKTQKVVID